MNAVATWTPEELDPIGQAEELHLAARRRDGALDAACHAKYDRYGPQIVGSVTGPQAHAVTIRLAKTGQHDPSQ
jgi:hypothetical protein